MDVPVSYKLKNFDVKFSIRCTDIIAFDNLPCRSDSETSRTHSVFYQACPAKHTNGINNSLIRRQFRDAEIGLFCFHNRIESNHLLHLSCIMISRKDMDQVLYIQTDECLIGVAKRKAACIEKIINMHIAVRLHQFI